MIDSFKETNTVYIKSYFDCFGTKVGDWIAISKGRHNCTLFKYCNFKTEETHIYRVYTTKSKYSIYMTRQLSKVIS